MDDVDAVLTNAIEEALAPPPPAPPVIQKVEPIEVELERIAYRAATLHSIAQELCRHPASQCGHCPRFSCIADTLYRGQALQVLARLVREGRIKYL